MKTLKTLLFITTAAVLSACGGDDEKISITPAAELTTNQAFEQILSAHAVPAIAGIYSQEGEVLEHFALGKRSQQSSSEVTLDDRWHLGSITKSFTATLAARLVETGMISWQTQIQEVFPASEYNNKFATITLIELLSHTAGIEADVTQVTGWEGYFKNNSNIQTQRATMASELLSFSGTQIGNFNYSNGGYVVAGAMLERVMQTSWENLLDEYVLYPLGIYDAQYGAPYDGFTFSQPYGHRRQNGLWQAVDATSDYADNPKVIGPAGTLNMSLNSLLTYANTHLQGERGNSEFLTHENFKRLHQVIPNTNYALGWAREKNVISHNGSNTMWFAVLAIDLEQQVIAIATTNVGGDAGHNVTENIINTLVARNTGN